MMFRWDQDTHDAILWLRANKNKFRMEVFEPPFMSLSVKDRRYANAVEACFVGNQIKVWYQSLTNPVDLLIDTRPLSLNVKKIVILSITILTIKMLWVERLVWLLGSVLIRKICWFLRRWVLKRFDNSYVIFLLPALTFFVPQMANLRFDGYAIDYVDYPAGMEWFLKRDINLHRTVNHLSFWNRFPFSDWCHFFLGYSS